jgi:UDP-glucose 4-epimerase
MGSYLVKSLADHGEKKVTVFDRPDARSLNLVSELGAEIYEGSFLDRDGLAKALVGHDIVYHLASTTVPQTSNDDPICDVMTNVIGTLGLLEEACKAHVKKVIFASSGGTVYGIPKEIPISENHPTEPYNYHGVGKLAIEKYLHSFWVFHGLDYCILRIANAYGERQPITGTQGVISSFLNKVIHSQELEIWGDGSIVRDYVYIGDIVNALYLAAKYDGEPRIFNIGAGQGHSINDIINIIKSMTRQSLKMKFLPNRPFDVPVNVLDISRARMHLDWQPSVGILEGIARTYEWMLKENER